MTFFLSLLIMVIGACLFGAAAALVQMGGGVLPLFGSLLLILWGFVYFMGELWDTL